MLLLCRFGIPICPIYICTYLSIQMLRVCIIIHYNSRLQGRRKGHYAVLFASGTIVVKAMRKVPQAGTKVISNKLDLETFATKAKDGENSRKSALRYFKRRLNFRVEYISLVQVLKTVIFDFYLEGSYFQQNWT